MEKDNRIDYQGPELKYRPSIGANRNRTTGLPSSNTGYHDLNNLRDLLRRLLEESNQQIANAESRLSRYNLKIDDNVKLENAHTTEWPATLGEPKNYISYVQYKSLEVRSTAASNYIRKTYEEYVRGPSGTNALDVLSMVSIVKAEATNIQGFLDDYIGDVNDSSEYRTLELLQDWAENALLTLQKTKAIYNSERSIGAIKELSATELDQTTPQRAAEYQALFQVKLNAINSQVVQLQEDLKKDYVTLSSIYYNKFLGPALKFRLNAMKNLESDISRTGVLGEEAFQANRVVNGNLQVLLSDQLKRNRAYEEKTNRLEDRIRDRDTYSRYINQLATKGKAVPKKFSDVPVTAEEDDAFTQIYEAGRPSSTTSFDTSHSKLSGGDDEFAHPQYILKAGDVVTGDLSLAEGVKIGGIVPNKHRHIGTDGSAALSGGALQVGSIPSSAVDPNDVPVSPGGMRVVSQTPRTIPPGVTVIDTIIAWEGSDGYTYEVQITRATT